MDRFWIPVEQWKEPFALRGEEAHHCGRVMRKRVGEMIEVFDGRGTSALAEICAISRDEIALTLTEFIDSKPLIPQIEIAVGIPKGKTFDLIIQKAVELGVSKISPLLSDQGMVKISPSEALKKQGKWQRIALEASKQCGQNFLPIVAPATVLDDFLARKGGSETKIVAALTKKTRYLRNVLREHRGGGDLTVLVGPEGDFSPREYQLISESCFQSVTLGGLVLRVETAILTLISAIRYEFQD